MLNEIKKCSTIILPKKRKIESLIQNKKKILTLKALIPPDIHLYVATPPGHIGSSALEMLSRVEAGGIGYEGQTRAVSTKSAAPETATKIN